VYEARVEGGTVEVRGPRPIDLTAHRQVVVDSAS
jgi:hypothetical protein